MIYQTLNGRWLINEKGSEAYVEGKIPGSVLSALLMQHRMQDPYFGTNEYAAREIFRSDFYFTRGFDVDPDLMSQERIYLCLKGVDTISRIYINDMPIGRTDNMHRTYYFNVKDYLRAQGNTITLEIESPIRYIENARPGLHKEIHYTPVGCMSGNQYLRKAHSMFGWDWGAQLPDCGIWRSVDLIGYSLIKLDEVEIIQHHEKKKVVLEINVDAELIRPDTYIIQAELVTPDGVPSAVTNTLIDGHSTIEIEIESPKLWWPNGFGEQPLYTVSVYALDMNGNQWDSKTYRIGLREITVSREPDEYGNEFCLKVNNTKIFAMGANYIPEDSIYSFITKEKISYLLRAAKKCNFNTIRVWGGGYYPSDTFYELCDEYGLIVWQDFMFACNLYELTTDFKNNITAEVIDNVKRLRHHACLGLFCGNNEIESAWDHWDGFMDHSPELKADYVEIFEKLIPDIVEKYARSTFYWPSSPSSGGGFDDPDDDNRGDRHYWGVWHKQEPFTAYREHYMRFCSEFGFQSFPCLKTIKTFTREEDRNIFSEVMESHQKNEEANGKILYYLSQNFLFPKDLDSLLYLSQILQGIAIKFGVEHMRRNRGRCMGALYWQLNDCWPVASWSSIDYFGRYKALQYMAKNFFAPIAGSIMREGSIVSVYIQNETRDIELRRVKLSLQTFDFRLLHEMEYEVEVQPGSVELVCSIDYAAFIDGIEDRVFAEAVFIDEDDAVVSTEIEIFVPYKRLRLENSSISYSVIELVDEYVIRMMSGGFAAFVELDLIGADAIFSENYFHLTSKREKAITLKKKDIRYLIPGTPEIQNGTELEQQLVIRTLRDTY
ncbi:MAG: glycoside hydrolase family 2 protein [Lachnospiraceae bacterium]|nr:glycoside hydrolase family 2 protein [Lachnospiraceae bacterium]